MASRNIVVGFGTINPEAFQRSYGLLFEELKKEGYGLALLHERASLMSHYPLLKDYLQQIPPAEDISLFPLMLNEGNEMFTIRELSENYHARIHPALLESEENLILSYIRRTCVNPSVHYVLLGHGTFYSDNSYYERLLPQLPQNISMLLLNSPDDVKEKVITTVPLMHTAGRHIQAMNEELKKDHIVTAMDKGILEDEQFRLELIQEIKTFLC